MDINNFNKFKNPLNNNFSFKVQNKNMNLSSNKVSLGFNTVNNLRNNSFNSSLGGKEHLENSINSFNINKPKEEEIFKGNNFSSREIIDESGRNIIQTEMRNKGSNW